MPLQPVYTVAPGPLLASPMAFPQPIAKLPFLLVSLTLTPALFF